MPNDHLHSQPVAADADQVEGQVGRSVRMSVMDEEKLPLHVRNCFVDICFEGSHWPREISVLETRPLGDEFLVDVRSGWEAAGFKVLLASENRLISLAKVLQQEAIYWFEKYRKLDNRNPINLGFVVRVRPDTLGPRLHWVRFSGKGRAGAGGQKTSFTEPVKLAGKFRYSSRIFAQFPEDIREGLMDVEQGAASVRYQVEKLTRLKRLCFEPHRPD